MEVRLGINITTTVFSIFTIHVEVRLGNHPNILLDFYMVHESTVAIQSLDVTILALLLLVYHNAAVVVVARNLSTI